MAEGAVDGAERLSLPVGLEFEMNVQARHNTIDLFLCL